ncbi:MAG: SCO family protein [Endozoicomonas sp.]
MQDAVKSSAPVKTKGRWQLMVVILVPVLSLGLAWFMYFYGQFVPDGRTNKGELMLPPASFGSLGLQNGASEFTLENLEGRWGILVFGSPACDSKGCQEALYQTRQVHIGLGREADRVVRAYISTEQLNSLELQKEHPEVFWLKGDKAGVTGALKTNSWPENRYFIVDPLGNIMMGYQADQSGGDLLKDLQRLLKASKIG